MNTEPIVIMVERDLEDLVPIFLAQRRADQATLATASPARDFEAIRKVGHGMVGACASYGFDDLGILGQRIVEAGRAADAVVLDGLKRELDDYMVRLIVKYL